MIVKNEAENLPRCLESARGLVDEIVVVDTGSTDETRSIALSYGAKLFSYTWSGHFADARNYSLQQSTGDWNLVLDADEYFIEDYSSEIRYFMTAGKGPGRIRRLDTFRRDGELLESQVYISRLLPKGSAYTGRIHEQVVCLYPSADTSIILHHDGYLDNTKSERNITILQAALEESGDDVYLLFQLAKEYRLTGQYNQAQELYKRSYSVLSDRDAFRALLVVDYLYNVVNCKAFEEGLAIIAAERNRLQDYPDFHFACGFFYMELVFSNVERYIEELPNIEKSYLTCLQLGESIRYDTVRGTGSFRAAYNLGVYYETMGNTGKARYYYEEAASKGYRPAVERLEKL